MSEIKWIKLSTGMFDDEKIKLIEKMPEADTIIVIWMKLLTMAGKVNTGGFIMLTESIPYTEDMLVSIVDRPIATVRMAIEVFQRFGMLEKWDDGRLYLSNWEKHQNIDGLDKIKAQTRNRVAKHREKLKQLSNGNVTCNATVTQCNATDKEEDIDKDNTLSHQKYDEENRYYQMAQYFHSKVMEHAVMNKVAHLIRKPNMQTWSDDFRKIIELDKRDPVELKTVIDWCTTDSFWSTNILSPKKLRDKYTELALKMKKPQSRANRADENKDLLRRRMAEVQNDSERDTTNPFLALDGLSNG